MSEFNPTLRVFKKFKIWKLADDLKSKGDPARAFSAVLELGRIGTDGAAEQLILALDRRDGVARGAARELGRLAHPKAIPALVRLLDDPAGRQAAAEALLLSGPRAFEAVLAALHHPEAEARRLVAEVLGELRDKRATEALIETLQTDGTFEVRTAAATALGQIKDARAVWALVATLKMRDEAEAASNLALDALRRAATQALRRIGDPLAASAKKPPSGGDDAPVLGTPEGSEAVSGLHPALSGDVTLLTQDEMVAVLQELVAASEELSWARLENRAPLLPPHFADYEQRWRTAETVGAELVRRGGVGLLREVFEQQLGKPEVVGNWWADAGWSLGSDRQA